MLQTIVDKHVLPHGCLALAFVVPCCSYVTLCPLVLILLALDASACSLVKHDGDVSCCD